MVAGCWWSEVDTWYGRESPRWREILRPSKRCYPLPGGRKAKLAEANRRKGAIAAELEAARKELETVSRRMTAEQDHDLAAVYGQRYKELRRQISGLDAPERDWPNRGQATKHIDDIAAAISFADPASAEVRRMAQDMHDFIEEKAEDGTWARIAYQTGVLVPTRRAEADTPAGHRGACPHVSGLDQTQAHDGQRWELQISVPGDDNGGRYRRLVNGGT